MNNVVNISLSVTIALLSYIYLDSIDCDPEDSESFFEYVSCYYDGR